MNNVEKYTVEYILNHVDFLKIPFDSVKSVVDSNLLRNGFVLTLPITVYEDYVNNQTIFKQTFYSQEKQSI